MLEVGMNLADRYEIVGKVGAGGMSDVYKAKDHVLGRSVAVKVLKPEFSEDRNFVTKFRTEAQSAAGLEHPNVVNIYDVGSEEGLHYIVMEYVEGITLKTYVEKKGQLTFKESISIAIQVARGIEAAHNKHLIHRDIKPQNIIISTEGKVKVTDFGIARAASSNTISADVMGSVHYASPEQARNGFVDGRSDIYSLGIVMYEMVTGRVPFDGDTTVAVALQHLQEEMTPPGTYAPDLPISMEKIILKCTQKNPDRRYQSIADLLTDLRRSLVSPDEDFVEIAPLVDNGKTKVISPQELEEIKERRAAVTPAEEKETPEPVQTKLGELEEVDLESDEDDEEDDGKLLSPKMDKAINIMVAVIAVIMVIAIIYLVASIFSRLNGGSSDRNNDVKIETETDNPDDYTRVINVVGKTQEEAERALTAQELKMSVKEIQESDKADGTVIEQLTDVGTEVKKGTVIEVIVSGNPNAADIERVPSVVGKEENTAKKELEDAGFTVAKEYTYDSTVEAGKVISQDPEGTTTAEKGSTVTILISQGVESTIVPTVAGDDQATAESKIKSAGLKCEVEEAYSDDTAEGKVIKASIEGGKTVQKGTTVTITVSKGSEVVYYTCSEQIDLPEGTVAVDATLYASDGSVIYSANNIPITKKKPALSVNKTDIRGYDSGYIYYVCYGEKEVSSGSDLSTEEGAATQTELYVIKEEKVDVTFTKQE